MKKKLYHGVLVALIIGMSPLVNAQSTMKKISIR